MILGDNATGCLSPVYYVLKRRNQNNNPKYLEYFFKYEAFQKSLVRIGNGILSHRMRIPMELLKCELITIPPYEEQEKIVKYLDYITNRIDTAIAAKKKLIALLNEQKQAIIHRAVTRGLDPNVKLKDSGIPWIGKVPEHWEIRKIGTISNLIVSNIDKHTKRNEKNVRLCNYTDIYKNEFIRPNMEFMHATASKDEINRYKLRIGDVVITKDSEEWNDIGVPALIIGEAEDLVCGYHLAILRPNNKLINSEYLFRCLQNKIIASQMHIKAKGVTRYGLSHQAIKDTLILLPNLNEQSKIVELIKTMNEKINKIISNCENEILLLNEIKKKVISDAVTGKICIANAEV